MRWCFNINSVLAEQLNKVALPSGAMGKADIGELGVRSFNSDKAKLQARNLDRNG
jgi:hypothetical protein